MAGQTLSYGSLGVAVRTGIQALSFFLFSQSSISSDLAVRAVAHVLSAGLQKVSCVGLN